MTGLAGLAFLATLALRLLLRRWSWVASQLLATAVLSAIAYLVYACALTVVESLGALGLAVSSALLLVETCALALSIYYVFEMLDVLGRREQPLPPPPADYLPVVALQVPTYDEPVDVVAGTLEALFGSRLPAAAGAGGRRRQHHRPGALAADRGLLPPPRPPVLLPPP